jgi:hypothetical protein
MPTKPIHVLRIEEGTVIREIRGVFERAGDLAEALRHTAVAADEAALADAFADAGPEELSGRATRLNGAALNALVLAVGLATEGGRLAALASVRRMVNPHGEEDDALVGVKRSRAE